MVFAHIKMQIPMGVIRLESRLNEEEFAQIHYPALILYPALKNQMRKD